MRAAACYVLSVLALHGALTAQALPPDLGFLKYTLTGKEPGDVYGHSLAAMGDLDADGWPDFAMGSIEVVRDPDALGEVLLVSGKSGKVIRSIRHAEAFRFGTQLFNCGDVDQDGLNDVVATGGSILSIHSSSSGRILRFERDPTGPDMVTAGYIDGDATPDLVLSGLENGQRTLELHKAGSGDLSWKQVAPAGEIWGSELVVLDDMDGDGAPEMATNDGVTDAVRGVIPAVHMRSGRSGEVIKTYTSPLDADAFAFEIESASDLDGDTFRDVAVSAPESPMHGLPGAGRVDVISSADGSVLWTQTGQDFEHEEDFFGGDEFGWPMVNIGDVTLDGKDEILVLSLRGLIAGATLARLSLCSGQDGAILATYEREDTYGSFGWVLSPLGDVDGDVRPEFLASAITWDSEDDAFDAGKVYALTYRPGEIRFIRADADQDGDADITDAVVILERLFRGRPSECDEAFDVDGSRRIDISDAIHLLLYLFQGSYAPAAPFPQCGSHEHFRGKLGCERSGCG